MRNTKYFSILGALYLMLISASVSAQPGDMPPNPQPGKCYAKCIVADEYKTSELSIPIYSGVDDSIRKHYTVDTTILIRPAGKRWVKRKADRNCLSDNPNDCLVWCLEDAGEERKKVANFLLDTTVTSKFIIGKAKVKTMVKEGGFTEWHEIVCANKVNKKFVKKLRSALGMPEKKEAFTIDSETKALLVKYQKEHNLPVGQLDYETLKHMGIKVR